jgi:hypothetical protein
LNFAGTPAQSTTCKIQVFKSGPGFRCRCSDAQLNDEVAPAGEPGLIGHDEPTDQHRFDGLTIDEISRCHQRNMRRIYDQDPVGS